MEPRELVGAIGLVFLTYQLLRCCFACFRASQPVWTARPTPLALTHGLADWYFRSNVSGLLLHWQVLQPPSGRTITGCVFLHHAAGTSMALPICSGEAAVFLERGLVVYLMDAQGHGLSEGTRMACSYAKGLRSAMFEDAVQFVDEMRARPGFPEGRPVFTAGVSQGGMFALAVAARLALRKDIVLGGAIGLSTCGSSKVSDFIPRPLAVVLRTAGTLLPSARFTAMTTTALSEAMSSTAAADPAIVAALAAVLRPEAGCADVRSVALEMPFSSFAVMEEVVALVPELLASLKGVHVFYGYGTDDTTISIGNSTNVSQLIQVGAGPNIGGHTTVMDGNIISIGVNSTNPAIRTQFIAGLRGVVPAGQSKAVSKYLLPPYKPAAAEGAGEEDGYGSRARVVRLTLDL